MGVAQGQGARVSSPSSQGTFRRVTVEGEPSSEQVLPGRAREAAKRYLGG